MADATKTLDEYKTEFEAKIKDADALFEQYINGKDVSYAQFDIVIKPGLREKRRPIINEIFKRWEPPFNELNENTTLLFDIYLIYLRFYVYETLVINTLPSKTRATEDTNILETNVTKYIKQKFGYEIINQGKKQIDDLNKLIVKFYSRLNRGWNEYFSSWQRKQDTPGTTGQQERSWYNPARLFYGNEIKSNQVHPTDPQHRPPLQEFKNMFDAAINTQNVVLTLTLNGKIRKQYRMKVESKDKTKRQILLEFKGSTYIIEEINGEILIRLKKPVPTTVSYELMKVGGHCPKRVGRSRR